MQQNWSGMPSNLPFSPTYEPLWLLTCATEDRFTPEVTHLDMPRHRIHSDKDLANALRALLPRQPEVVEGPAAARPRDHRIPAICVGQRTLSPHRIGQTIFCISHIQQFEVHQNRFADIRKVPDVPPQGGADYDFEPSDLLPPVGSNYLLHLHRNPEDYDGELITYLRAPKRNGRLPLGVGWGINLVEGSLAEKVWIWLSAIFAASSLMFGVVYAVKKHDIQGAFGVAAWLVTSGVLAAGWLQACLG